MNTEKTFAGEFVKNSWQYNQRQRHSDVIKFYPKQWNDKDFDPIFWP